MTARNLDAEAGSEKRESHKGFLSFPLRTSQSILCASARHVDFRNVRSDFSEQHEDEDDHEDETEAAARAVAPLAAMRPSGQRTDEHEDENDEEDGG